MVPPATIDQHAAIGFPRASGDGPEDAKALMLAYSFPPRERGWSLVEGGEFDQELVSPARAGMVRGRCGKFPPCPRFPRASGDGPSYHWPMPSRARFPPRERGWSLMSFRVALCCHVSPARAGMVPAGCPALPSVPRFPRASGDGPKVARLRDILAGFPPRERGWSRGERSNRKRASVSPARAGMVLTWRTEAAGTSRFPRASGDGPVQWVFAGVKSRFPPRERGWSRL